MKKSNDLNLCWVVLLALSVACARQPHQAREVQLKLNEGTIDRAPGHLDKIPSPELLSSGDEAQIIESLLLAIENRLQRYPELQDLKLEWRDGVVTLEGSVASSWMKQELERITLDFGPVRSVKNRLRLRQSFMDDRILVERAQEVLQLDSMTQNQNIKVQVTQGQALLTGAVTSWNIKLLAQLNIERLRGIQVVQNHLQLKRDSKLNPKAHGNGLLPVSPDGQLQRARPGRSFDSMDWDSMPARPIHWIAMPVNSTSDKSYFPNSLLQQLAEEQHGPQNHQLANMIRTRWAANPRLAQAELDLDVQGSDVIMSGLVDQCLKQQLAQALVEAIPGVTRVRNLIQVVPAQDQGDEAIQASVKIMALYDSYLYDDNISVQVQGGQVELWGQVDNYDEKIWAENLAQRMYGVLTVNNRLIVSLAGVSQDLPKIIEGLWYWYTPMEGGQIKVEQRGQEAVVLNGEVYDLQTQQLAQELAYQAGAPYVINRIKIAHQ